MKTYAIIPARGGSVGVPKKSIMLFAGFPLLAYSIAAAKLSKKIDRIIVSTDSEEMADVAKRFGAEVPFLRPAEFARHDSPDLEFVQHAIKWFEENEEGVPDFIVHLRPTTPLRKPEDIDAAIEHIAAHPDATSLRSGFEIRESPYKLLGVDGKYFTGLFPNDPRPEYWNLPRQSFPPVYQPDGYVDVLKPAHVTSTNTMHGTATLAFMSSDTGEVDTLKDFEFLEFKLTSGTWEVYEYLKKHFS